MVYRFNLYSCQYFFGFFNGKEVYMRRHAQSARTRSKIAAHCRGREISPGIGRRAGAGRLPEPFAIHPGRHHRKIIARRHFALQGTGFAAASNWKEQGGFRQEPLSDSSPVRICVEREGGFKKSHGFRAEIRLKVEPLFECLFAGLPGWGLSCRPFSRVDNGIAKIVGSAVDDL